MNVDRAPANPCAFMKYGEVATLAGEGLNTEVS
jgi:hypothetical protein